MKKVIAMKFADPLVKGLPLAYHLRICLLDWDGQNHLLTQSSPHILHSHQVPQNNVIFVHLGITLYTATLTTSNCGGYIYS